MFFLWSIYRNVVDSQIFIFYLATWYSLSCERMGGVAVITDTQRVETSFGVYVYLTAWVTSLFDSREIYEDTFRYYN